VDGIFGTATRNAVIAAQRYFGLPQTGSVDAATWEEIYDQFAGIENESLRNGEAFPRLPAAVPTFAQTNTGRSRYSRTSTLTQFPGFDLQAGQRDPVRQEVVR
jgi:peptidoglycan hydrolase-like protein with peptidoglycan-binding domain